MTYCKNFIILVLVIIKANMLLAAHEAAPTPILELDNIVCHPLNEEYDNNFVPFFVHAFETLYMDYDLKQLGKDREFLTKKEWLKSVADGEMKNALRAQENAHRIVFSKANDIEKNIIAYLSIHIEKGGDIAYLGQACVAPSLYGQGAVQHTMMNVIPKYAPQARRYTLLVRKLNGRGIAAYQKLGFRIDETDELVRQHDYPEEHYLGMFIDI